VPAALDSFEKTPGKRLWPKSWPPLPSAGVREPERGHECAIHSMVVVVAVLASLVSFRAVHRYRHVIMLRYIGMPILTTGEGQEVVRRLEIARDRQVDINFQRRSTGESAPADKVCRVAAIVGSRLLPPRASVICFLVISIACFSAAGEDGVHLASSDLRTHVPSDELTKGKEQVAVAAPRQQQPPPRASLMTAP
jgi:hypothetical protein